MKSIATLILLLGFSSWLFADDPIVVATWNVGFIDRDISDLDIEGFVEEVDFDVLIVNERGVMRAT